MTEKESLGKKVCRFVGRLPSLLMICVIELYRALISPLLPSSCRFTPTCSEYGLQAFKRFGFVEGFKLTVKRIIRCRPGGPYGYDPVPEKPVDTESSGSCRRDFS